MESRKFQLFLKGRIIGLIFISDNHPQNPNGKVGTIFPLKREGSWENNDLAIIGQNTITDFFELTVTDEDIKLNLANRIDYYPNNLTDSDFVAYQ